MDDLEFEWDDSIYLKWFLPIINLVADIYFFWGGRDSGKSRQVAQKLLIDCLEQESFRCVLIRKTFNSIKGSQFQLLQDIVSEWGLDEWFKFNQTTLEIKCLNGNKFIARGCDDPAKLKSLANPTCAWFEEGNQLTQEDYIIVSTTLRSNEGRVKQYHTFNPEALGDYEKHWLWPWIAENYKKGILSFEGEKVVKLPNGDKHIIKYVSTHTTYHDNHFVTPERIAALEQLVIIDPYYYQVFVKGLWGNQKNDRPFVLSYNPEKHDGLPAHNPMELTHLSFDFNKNPMCCSVIQHYGGKVYVLRTIKIPNSDIYELCDFILAYYPNSTFKVTGDASGSNANAMVPDNLNYYKIIMQKLNLSPFQMTIPNANPPLRKNRMVVNAVLATYPVEIHETDASELIWDFVNVRAMADGSIEKRDRDDEAQQADALDTWRYFCNTEMLPYINLAV